MGNVRKIFCEIRSIIVVLHNEGKFEHWHAPQLKLTLICDMKTSLRRLVLITQFNPIQGDWQ